APVQTITVTAAAVGTLYAYMNIKDILDNAHNKRVEEAKAAEILKETQEKEAIAQHRAELRHNLVAEADKLGLFDKKTGLSKGFGLAGLGLKEIKPVIGIGPVKYDLDRPLTI